MKDTGKSCPALIFFCCIWILILADLAVKCCRNGGAKLYTDKPAVLMSSQVNVTMSSMNQQPPVSHLFFPLITDKRLKCRICGAALAACPRFSHDCTLWRMNFLQEVSALMRISKYSARLTLSRPGINLSQCQKSYWYQKINKKAVSGFMCWM